MEIDWGDLGPSHATDMIPEQESSPLTSGDIDWAEVGTLDVCEIEVVEESMPGEEEGMFITPCGHRVMENCFCVQSWTHSCLTQVRATSFWMMSLS